MTYSAVIAECNHKYQLARLMDYTINPADYQWILGWRSAETLTSYNQKIVYDNIGGDMVRTLFGIKVEIDTVNSDRIQLFKEIK